MGFGSFLNSLTGAAASAKQQQRYALQQQAISLAAQKEMAQNAHQWEVTDLEKAGLNPILSAGGTGASTGGMGATAGGPGGQNAMGITDIANSAIQAASVLSQNKLNENQETKNAAETRLADAQADALNLSNPYIPAQQKAQLAKQAADTDLARKNSAKTEAETTRISQGAGGYVFGTDDKNAPNKLLGGVIAGAFPWMAAIGKGKALYNSAKAAKNFSNFLKATK